MQIRQLQVLGLQKKALMPEKWSLHNNILFAY